MNLVVNEHNVFVIVIVTLLTSLILVPIIKKWLFMLMPWTNQMQERFTKFQCQG